MENWDFFILLSHGSVILSKTLGSQKLHKNFAKCLISLCSELHLQKCRVITSLSRFSSSILKILGASFGIYPYTQWLLQVMVAGANFTGILTVLIPLVGSAKILT